LKIISVAVFAAYLTFTSYVHADTPPRTPLESYLGTAFFKLEECRLVAGLNFAYAENNSRPPDDAETDYTKCIIAGSAESTTKFRVAIKTVKKEKAREALKSYQVAVLSALDGVSPGLDERKFAYQQRQQSLQEKVTEARSRFEIER
jgi:hypothetical protein